MSTLKSQILAGSRGSQVEELQKALNNHGYGLSVDGIFGSATEAAVRDFQKKQGLSVDGIVGTNTWGKLFPTTTASASGTSTEYKTADGFKYNPYSESDAVRDVGQKRADAENALSSYGSYAFSNEELYNEIFNKIMNREDFSYDLNGDALYQQYKDRYIQQGKMAMQDTMGQAAALTGGYGSSYASTAGNQAYQGYLQGLNDVIPELQQMAYERYRDEGQDLLNQYAMLSDENTREYGMWKDGYDRAVANLDYYTGLYSDERAFDYGQHIDEQNLAYTGHRNAITDAHNQAIFDDTYGKQDVSSDGNDEVKVEVPDYYKDDTGKVTYGSYNNRGYSDDIVKAAQEYVGATADGKWGSDSAQKAKDKGFSGLQAVVEAMGGEEKAQYAVWDAGDWEAYFAYIRQTDGRSAAMEEFDRMTQAGLIPKNMATYASIGVRGGNTGH